MNKYIPFDSGPMGALIALPEIEMDKYVDDLAKVPPRIFGILNDPRTGAFIRGLVKGHQLPEQKSPVVALAILLVVLGRDTLVKLPSILSTELKLSNDQAYKMAKEIEEDLLGPVMEELKRYWSGKWAGGTEARDRAEEVGLPNVLNLKDQEKPPSPPPMPGSTSN